MQPVLLQLGPVTFYSFGVFAAAAFAVGVYVTFREADRDKLPRHHRFDYALYTAIAALIGARLWYLIFRPDEAKSFWELFTVGGGGLALPGGILAGAAVLAFALRRTGQPVRPWFDAAAIGTVAGLAVGKLGSFLNGDGFGAPSGLPWAVKFTDTLAPASVTHESLHPLQLYAAFLFGALAFGLWRFRERVRLRGGWEAGSTFWAGLLGLSMIELVLERSPEGGVTSARQVRPEPYWIAAAGLVVADQVSKWLVVGMSSPIALPGVFIGEALNVNGLLGLELPNSVLIVLGLVICAIILALLAFKAERPPVRLGLWLMLGGAFSNTLDRILHGGVVDIISILDLSQFNLADVMILTGVLCLLRGIWWRD